MGSSLSDLIEQKSNPSSSFGKPKSGEAPHCVFTRDRPNLQPGDHVQRPMPGGSRHHAIVTGIEFEPVESAWTMKFVDIYNGDTSVSEEIVDDQHSPFIYIKKEWSVSRWEKVEYAEEEMIDVTLQRVAFLLHYATTLNTRYNLVLSNCEHVATWCKTGHWLSRQVCEFFHLWIPFFYVDSYRKGSDLSKRFQLYQEGEDPFPELS